MKKKIKIYPVGNGDTSLIVTGTTTLIVDCKLRKSSENENDDTAFDVKKGLLNELQKRNNNPYTDVFILTHPDQDHCLGFKTNFYQGNPDDYGITNRNNGEIMIDELWVTSMIFSNDQSEDAHAIRNEANRRIRLAKNNDSSKNKKGNRIRMIGYDNNSKFENVESHIPGTIVNTFNGKKEDCFSIFIHAPFKNDLVKGKADKDRNATSIVFQARFKNEASDENFIAKVMFGGDADHYVWEQILEKSKTHKNEDALEFDIFIAPHHCSWSYFNDVPYGNDANKEPKAYSLEVLDYGNDDCYIISSSRKVLDEEPNPPHFAAKNEYLEKMTTEDNFLNTAIYPSEEKPQPIVFSFDENGITLEPCEANNNETEADEAALFEIARRAKSPWCNVRI